MAQLAEFVAVEAIEPVLGAEPHEARGVLHDGVDGLLRESFLEAVALHAERRCRAGGAGKSGAQRGESDARDVSDRPDFSPLFGHFWWVRTTLVPIVVP